MSKTPPKAIYLLFSIKDKQELDECKALYSNQDGDDLLWIGCLEELEGFNISKELKDGLKKEIEQGFCLFQI